MKFIGFNNFVINDEIERNKIKELKKKKRPGAQFQTKWPCKPGPLKKSRSALAFQPRPAYLGLFKKNRRGRRPIIRPIFLFLENKSKRQFIYCLEFDHHTSGQKIRGDFFFYQRFHLPTTFYTKTPQEHHKTFYKPFNNPKKPEYHSKWQSIILYLLK